MIEIRSAKKKALQAELAQGAAPVFLDPLAAFSFVTSRRLSFFDKAGLLTLGSSSHPHLPIRFMNSGILADFVPDYSGGTAPDFHGIPLKLLTEHLVDIFFNPIGSHCQHSLREKDKSILRKILSAMGAEIGIVAHFPDTDVVFYSPRMVFATR